MSIVDAEFTSGRGVVRFALGVAVLGVGALVVLLAGRIVEPSAFFFSYLVAYNYALSIVVGALLFLMICHAMHATWPVLLRRLSEATVATLPLLALLFIPIVIGAPVLYPWLRLNSITDERTRDVVALKAPYLNLGGYVFRSVLYFSVWIIVTYWLQRWSTEQDERPRPELPAHMHRMSSALLPLVGFTVSFAAFDWVMSLTPTWFSSMYPVYYFAGGFVSALALITVLTWAVDRGGIIQGITSSHYYALGRLLLAFVVFWAYAAFFQFMLIWIANQPDEVTFYLNRNHGAWKTMSIVLIVTQFALPFLVLLNYDIKRRRGPLALVAAWLLGAHYIDIHWLVMPTVRQTGPAWSVVDLVTLFVISGVTVAYGVTRIHGRHLVPLHDPNLASARRYESR